jgi:hypothetical protein
VATILKSQQATEVTFLLLKRLQSFAHYKKCWLRHLWLRAIKKTPFLKKSAALMADLLDQDMAETESETTLEVNFVVLKLKHTTKGKKD